MTMSSKAVVIIIDDHEGVRESLRILLETTGFQTKAYASAETFLAEGVPQSSACLIVDIRLPGMSGLELQEELARRDVRLPLIVMTGHADVALAVKAMKGGALDFLEKPIFDEDALLATIRRAIQDGNSPHITSEETMAAAALIAQLTGREHEVLGRLTLGESNKQAAFSLGISSRTVETHRARILEKLAARNVSDLIRTVRTATQVC
jgi:two-component system response regulator FixJ